jgi:hypothetical protein
MKGSVIIPKSELAGLIAKTASVQLRMRVLLRELEEDFKKKPATHIGGWRQDPIAWQRSND